MHATCDPDADVSNSLDCYLSRVGLFVFVPLTTES